MKRCGRCGFECPMEMAAEHFYRSSRARDGYQYRCVRCSAETDGEIRQRYPKRYKDAAKRAHEKRQADAERRAEHLEYMRTYSRKRRGSTRVDKTPRTVLVPAAPVRDAVLAWGRGWRELGALLERDATGIRRHAQGDEMPAELAAVVLEAIGVLPAEIGL